MMKITKDNCVSSKCTTHIPILNLEMMSDEHWNRLAYQNWLERRCVL